MILFYTRIPLEYNAARNALYLKEETKNNSYRYSLNQDETIGLFCGSISSFAIFLKGREIQLIIDTGTCGALDPTLKIGTVIVSERSFSLKDHTLINASIVPDNKKFLPFIQRENSLTVSSPIDNIILRDQLFGNFKKRICNMESAEVFEISNALNIPVISVRVVSDYCEGKSLRLFKKSVLAHLPRLYRIVLKTLI